MAAIRNLSLSINNVAGGMSDVTVTYEVVFSRPEILTGATFMERVGLRGSDIGLDDDLMPDLLNRTTRAQAAPIRRTVTRRVADEALDEDRDALIGAVLMRQDEVFARVTLTPFLAMPASAKSNIVIGSFGTGR